MMSARSLTVIGYCGERFKRRQQISFAAGALQRRFGVGEVNATSKGALQPSKPPPYNYGIRSSSLCDGEVLKVG